MDSRRRRLFSSAVAAGGKIVFTLVSEPQNNIEDLDDEEEEESSAGECRDVGTAEIDLEAAREEDKDITERELEVVMRKIPYLLRYY